MSQTLQVVRRYAKALLDVAAQTAALEQVRTDVAEVRRWLAGAPAFQVLAACDHLGGKEARIEALRKLTQAAGLGPVVSEFVTRVEAAQHLEHLGAILDDFERQRKERAGIIRAEIVSARPLSESQKAELVRRFGAERQLEISYKEDPGILGGFVARIGEQIHDYSVSGRLARLRRRYAEA